MEAGLIQCHKCKKDVEIGKYVGGTEIHCSCGERITVPYRGLNVDWSSLPGKLLGGCLVEKKLGQGGIGVVFKGIHQNLKTPVAIKILSPALTANPEHVDRFKREAQLTAGFQHANIVSVLDVGMDLGLHYIIMQYIHGRTVQDILNEKGYLQWKKAVTIAREAARGLKEAHEKGIIHRDVKPDNIMITLDKGQVKITDFGLARSVEVDKSLTHTGQVLGTPYFMSPEQCQGRVVDIRADIYSLGATLFYMITGHKPFDGDSYLDICLKHINEPLPDPCKIRKDNVPPILAKIIAKMMAKRPEQRYSNCDPLITDLTRIQKGNDTSIWTSTPENKITQRMGGGAVTPTTQNVGQKKSSASNDNLQNILTPSTYQKTISSQTPSRTAVPITPIAPSQLQQSQILNTGSNRSVVLLFLLVVLAALALGAFVFLKEKDRYQEYMDKGISLFGEKKFQEAKSFFERAQQQKDTAEVQRELTSTRFAILFEQAQKAEQMEDWEQMKSLYERLAALKPEDPTVLGGRKQAQYQISFIRGRESLQEEDYEEASQHFETAYSLFKKEEVLAFITRIEILKALKQLKQLEETDFQKALAFTKNFVEQKKGYKFAPEEQKLFQQFQQKLQNLLDKETLFSLDFKILVAQNRENWDQVILLCQRKREILQQEVFSPLEKLALFQKQFAEGKNLFFQERWGAVPTPFDKALEWGDGTDSLVSPVDRRFVELLKQYALIREDVKRFLGDINEQYHKLLICTQKMLEDCQKTQEVLWCLESLKKIIDEVKLTEKNKELFVQLTDEITKKTRIFQIQQEFDQAYKQKRYLSYQKTFQKNIEEFKILAPKKTEAESKRNFEVVQALASIPSEMFLVENGSFEMGDEQEGLDSYPKNRVQISSFLLDRAEVTVEEYKKFLDTQPKIKHPEEPETFNRTPDQWELQLVQLQAPVVGINWYDAYAYATWVEKQLPTEAQFEYATHLYLVLNQNRLAEVNENIASGKIKSATDSAKRIASFDFPAQNLRGNVAEWCTDYYDAQFYQKSLNQENPQNQTPSPTRVLRGASFEQDRTPSTRANLDPLTRKSDVGFRCIKLLK